MDTSKHALPNMQANTQTYVHNSASRSNFMTATCGSKARKSECKQGDRKKPNCCEFILLTLGKTYTHTYL